MRRRNLRIIGITTALLTVITLNLVLGESRWAYQRGYGHWRNHCWADDYRNNQLDKIPPDQTR